MERKEAIEVVKKNYPHVTESGSQFETALRTLIPELKESEDERIRKEIIEFICWAVDRGSITEKQREKSDSWFSWLEKQGEQKPAWSEEDEVKRNALICLVEEIKNQPLKRLEDWDGYISWLKSLKDRMKGE